MVLVTVPASFRPQKLDIKLYLQTAFHHTMNLLLSSVVVILAVSLPRTEGECIDRNGFFRYDVKYEMIFNDCL